MKTPKVYQFECSACGYTYIFRSDTDVREGLTEIAGDFFCPKCHKRISIPNEGKPND